MTTQKGYPPSTPRRRPCCRNTGCAWRALHLLRCAGGPLHLADPGARPCARGIRIIDTRHEATAVFAADAAARLSGRPGVAAVTAGPGITNTITALKNAQLAQSPLVADRRRRADRAAGAWCSLQDIDQRPLVGAACQTLYSRSLGCASWRCRSTRRSGWLPAGRPRAGLCRVPGRPASDDEANIRQWYAEAGRQGYEPARSCAALVSEPPCAPHVRRQHRTQSVPDAAHAVDAARMGSRGPRGRLAGRHWRGAERPLAVIGSQAVVDAGTGQSHWPRPSAAWACPVYLSGMARGLLGRRPPAADAPSTPPGLA